MVLVLCEMQSVTSRIWTRVVVSISYDDNYYTTGTSLNICLSIFISISFTVYSYLSIFLSIYQSISSINPKQVLETASSVHTDLIYVSPCFSANPGTFMRELRSWVYRMPFSCCLEGLWDWRYVAPQPLFCGGILSRICSK